MYFPFLFTHKKKTLATLTPFSPTVIPLSPIFEPQIPTVMFGMTVSFGCTLLKIMSAILLKEAAILIWTAIMFSTEDLRTWTDHGEILHSKDVNWGIEGGGWMWAPGAAYKNNTYYLYFPHKDKTGKWRIGVSTSQKPEGPFSDISHYIPGTYGIDPICFIDDDGTAYLYFDKVVAKLKNNMVELAEPPRQVFYGANDKIAEEFQMREAPWMYKKDKQYYFSYCNFRNQENQGFYAIGDSPYGPFNWKGVVNKKPAGAQDHHSIVKFKGSWYYFYHTGNYTGKWGQKGKWYLRTVCVDRLYYNPDGTMKVVVQTNEAVNVILKD